MPFYLEMSKNTTQQRDIYDIVIFRFLQIFYGLTIRRTSLLGSSSLSCSVALMST